MKRSAFAACVLVALTIAVVGFLALADMIQFVVHLPNEFTYRVFALRWPMVGLFGISFLASLVLGFRYRILGAKWLAAWTLLALGLFVAGFVNPSYLMFRSQQHGAEFVSVVQAREELADHEEVVVVRANGVARAFPYRWINQPHVAGADFGGREVAMTWCGLSHLGHAYETRSEDGQELDLKVMTQLENNLVLFDARTETPIQQIQDRTIGSDSELVRVPSVMMSLEAFARLHPDGSVFYAPATNLFDRLTRTMMFDSTEHNYDKEKEGFAFPTIPEIDRRVDPKEQVYAFVLSGKPVAVTLGHLQANGGSLVVGEGDATLTIKYFPEYDFVDVFKGRVPEVDAHGLVDGQPAERFPHSNRVLWAIWANWYPETIIDGRGPEARQSLGT